MVLTYGPSHVFLLLVDIVVASSGAGRARQSIRLPTAVQIID